MSWRPAIVVSDACALHHLCLPSTRWYCLSIWAMQSCTQSCTARCSTRPACPSDRTKPQRTDSTVSHQDAFCRTHHHPRHHHVAVGTYGHGPRAPGENGGGLPPQYFCRGFRPYRCLCSGMAPGPTLGSCLFDSSKNPYLYTEGSFYKSVDGSTGIKG